MVEEAKDEAWTHTTRHADVFPEGTVAETIVEDIAEYPLEVREEAADELLEETVADAPPNVTEDWVEGATAGIAKVLGLEHESDNEGEQ